MITISLFFLNVQAPHKIYTLPLHDALPIYPDRAYLQYVRPPHAAPRRPRGVQLHRAGAQGRAAHAVRGSWTPRGRRGRSEEHTSELQSLTNLVCRLLLVK